MMNKIFKKKKTMRAALGLLHCLHEKDSMERREGARDWPGTSALTASAAAVKSPTEMRSDGKNHLSCSELRAAPLRFSQDLEEWWAHFLEKHAFLHLPWVPISCSLHHPTATNKTLSGVQREAVQSMQKKTSSYIREPFVHHPHHQAPLVWPILLS